MVRPGRIVMLVSVVGLLVLVPAGRSSVEPWALEAERHLAALEQAQRRGIADQMRYVAPDVVMDTFADDGVTTEGRADLARWLASAFGPTLEEVTDGDVYLDVTGAVVDEHFVETPPGTRTWDDLAVLDMGPRGLITRSTHPLALDSAARALASLREDIRTSGEEELQAAEALAAAYLRAWSSADPLEVQALYTPSARLMDSLLQLDLQGRDAIGTYAATRADVAPAGLRQHTIPDGGGPAIYIIWPDGFRSAREHGFGLLVAYTADDRTDCPDRLVASLRVSAGVIEEERRFHEVDAVRRCHDGEQLPPGWWAALEPLPPLPQDEVTGVVEVDGQRIELHDGTPALERLVRWAMGRYEAADLAAPRVSSVVFGREEHFLQCTDERNGLTLDLGDTAETFVCLGEREACTNDECTSFTANARLLVLHELAHAWMDRHLDDGEQRAFLDHMGLEHWDGADVRWERRGVEQAAQVIAWGLMDEPVAPTRLGDRSCTELAEAFQVLTGVRPQAHCAVPGP
jgi:hypothetical protein